MREEDLGQIVPDFIATATVDDTIGKPEVSVSIEEIEDLGRILNKIKFSFLHLKGDKPKKGVDYYTPQEREQFTIETKSLVSGEGEKQTALVSGEGEKQTALVSGEGNKQIALLNAEIEKLLLQIKDIVGKNPTTTNALTLGGKTRIEFENDLELLSSNNVIGIKSLSKRIGHISKILEKDLFINKYNGLIKLDITEQTPKATDAGFSIKLGPRDSLLNKVIYIYSKEVEPLSQYQISPHSWGNPLLTVKPKPVPNNENLYYITWEDIKGLQQVEDSTDIYLLIFNTSKWTKIGVNYYNIFISDDKTIIWNPTIDKRISESMSISKLLYDEIYKSKITIQKGYLNSEGRYYDEKLFSKSIVYSCKEGDIFLYKGVGQSQAYSYLMKLDNTIIQRGQVDSTKDYTEVTIPAGVNNIIFSSYATQESDIIFDVKRKEPFLIEKFEEIIGKENIIKDVWEKAYLSYDELIQKKYISQKGYLLEDGRYGGINDAFSKSIKYFCKEGDVFLYKGVGQYLAQSYIYKQYGNVIGKGQIQSTDKYTEVIIPKNVNEVEFSSYAIDINSIIFDVKRKQPTMNNRVSKLEELISIDDPLVTTQKGYLNSDGNYQDDRLASKSVIYPCKKGEVFLYKGTGQHQAYSYLMKLDNTIIQRGQVDSTKDYTEVTIPAGVNNIIFSSYATQESDIIFDVKRKNYTDLMHRVINIEDSIGNVLTGKKWVACGDSFTEGDFTGFVDDNGLSGHNSPVIFDKEWNMYKTYPWWIAKRNGMKLINEAKCGSIMALSKQHLEGTQDIGYRNPFAYERYKKIPEDTNYVTIWFGINDSYNTNLGTINDADNKTFYGAWNVVLEWLITNRPYTKIGIIVTNGGANKLYRQAIREIAEKWGIPYLDMMGNKQVPVIFGRESELHLTSIAEQTRRNSFIVSQTNSHPNLKAHEYQSTFIENFLRSL